MAMNTEVPEAYIERAIAPEAQQEAVVSYLELLSELKTEPEAVADPALLPLYNQVENHLRHVSYNFRIASGSDDMPYALPRNEAFPAHSTQRALDSATRLFDVTDIDRTNVIEKPTITLNEAYGKTAREAQDAIVKDILADPMAAYDDFSERRKEGGAETPFPELGWTIKALFYDMVAKPEVLKACEASPVLNDLRSILISNVQAKIEEDVFGYKSSLDMIEDVMGFFDVAVRVNDPESNPPYHSARFEYNWHSLSENEEHTLLPTMASVNPTDLLTLRGVPIGLVGVSTSSITVDAYKQTPYEFFHHDVDHTRRMYEATEAAIEREGVTPRKYAEDATHLIKDILLPAIDTTDLEDGEERDRRISMRMILFEVLHEDGADATCDTIAEGILRAPMERTPFEQPVTDTMIEYYMAPRATTLAHVFRKLAHTFYDYPENRSPNLGTEFVRTRTAIAEGAAALYRLVSDDPIEDDALLETCRGLVSTDEGFTDGFIGGIAHDIRRRAVGSRTLSLMITRPLGVTSAVRKMRSFRPKTHSLFGYSALEYENTDKLAASIIADLSEMDPEETAIAIGATPYGIGQMYPIVKDLGFMTLGIVSSTAVGRNEESARGVDEIVVVKDSEWGGYRYGQQSTGGQNGPTLLSPTTRVFVGGSDSISAYGGGGITAVTIEEMVRRGKHVSFEPFDMNHKAAEISQGQRGNIGEIDYAGPANAKWLELTHTV